MATRAIGVLAIALAAVAMAGCSRAETPEPSEKAAANRQAEPQKPKRPDGVVGYYVLDDPVFYGTLDMRVVPPGQVLYLGIEEGRWMMRSLLTAWGGTWAGDHSGATLTMNVGPIGKANGKETMAVARTAIGLTLTHRGSSSPALRFTYVGLAAPKNFGYDEFLGQKK